MNDSNPNSANPQGSLHTVVRVCGVCRHWKIAPEKRHIFGFAERLSSQIGRRVEIGYCHATHEIGTGPTADADWCDKWEANSNESAQAPTHDGDSRKH